MKKKSHSHIKNQYKYEKENNAYLIEVSLDDYDEVYDDWDPSPFKKRDIEDEFNDFIYQSSEDIPFQYNLYIILYLLTTTQDIKKENALIFAYRNFYAYALEKIQRNWQSIRKRTITYLGLSFVFLGVGYFYSTDAENVLLSVLNEGVFIGGWVFLWEFFTDLFITRRDLGREYKLYKRLYESEVRFVYSIEK